MGGRQLECTPRRLVHLLSFYRPHGGCLRLTSVAVLRAWLHLALPEYRVVYRAHPQGAGPNLLSGMRNSYLVPALDHTAETVRGESACGVR